MGGDGRQAWHFLLLCYTLSQHEKAKHEVKTKTRRTGIKKANEKVKKNWASVSSSLLMLFIYYGFDLHSLKRKEGRACLMPPSSTIFFLLSSVFGHGHEKQEEE